MKKFLSLILVLLVTHAAWAQSSAFTINLPTSNLEAWYPDCWDTTDHGGIGYDLYNRNLTETTDRFGFNNTSHYFNGANSQMHYSTFFSMAGAFAYSCWIYPVAAQKSVILYNGDADLNGMGLSMGDTTGLLPGDFVCMLVGGIGVQLSKRIDLYDWHHIVLVRSGNAYVLYVDQVYVGAYIPTTTPTFPGFFAPTNVFQLGANYHITSPATANSFFSGKIDDIAIYSRLLTNTDVHKLYQYNPDVVVPLGNDTAICADSIQLPAPGTGFLSNYPYPYYHYRWDTGVGLGSVFIDSASSIATESIWAHPSVAGTKYILEVTRPLPTLGYGNTGNACIGRDTIVIRHVAVNINIGPADTTFCLGNSFTLNQHPVAGETYTWSTGAVTDSIHAIASGLYYVTADSSFLSLSGGIVHCYGSDTINIHVPDSIRVHLTSDTLCDGRDTVFLYSKDSLTYGSPHYLYGGPPSVGGSTASVAVATVTGTYWLQVTDSSCIASDTVRVIIIADTVHVYNPYTQICRGGTVITNASFNPGLHYQWTPTAGIPSSTNPATTITPDTSAWYVLTATVDSVPKCISRDSFYIDVQPNPFVYAGGNRSVCINDTIRITPTILPAWYTHYIYDWSPGNFLDDSTAASVIFTPGDTTTLVLRVSTPAGCFGIDSAVIFVHSSDFATLDSSLTVCPGAAVTLTPSSGEVGTTTYVWHPGTYLDDSTSATPVVRPDGSLTYTAVATSQYGCKDSLKLAVTVKPGAVITLEDSVAIFPGQSYQITPHSNATWYSWTPPLGLNDTAISNPIATPAVSTKYILTVRSEDGCVAKDSIKVKVDEGTVMAIPNAFSPGSDFNSTIKVIMRGVARLKYFRIYNRWGNLMFETTDPNVGWDGNLNGKPQPFGVYIYDAQATTDKGFVMQKQGNITLLR